MTKGGFRSLAGRHPGGRPRGSRDKAKRMPKRTAPSPGQLVEARDRARAWLTANEDAVVDGLMNSGDTRVMLELLKLFKAYGDGPPQQRIEITTRRSPEAILEELAMRRMAIDSEALAEPAQLTEAPLPARAPVPAQVAPPVPSAAPVAQETPSRLDVDGLAPLPGSLAERIAQSPFPNLTEDDW